MTSMIAKAEILKQDGRGRVRLPPARREALLDEFERSGTSGVKFARLAGIKDATFAGWVQKRRKERGTPGKTTPCSPSKTNDPGPSGGPVRLFEVLVEDANTAGREVMGVRGLLIELPGGSRLLIELSFTGGLKVFVALEPVDLRKNRAERDSQRAGLVSQRLGEDLRRGALFVFTNRRHTRLKILSFDGTEEAEGNREAGGRASKACGF